MRRAILISIISLILIGVPIVIQNNVSAQLPLIPSWIKNTAKLWGESQLSDSEFINAIQWLIDQKILVVHSKSESTGQLQSESLTSTQDLLPKVNDLGNEWNAGKIINNKNGGSAGFVESFSQTLTRNNSNETIHVEITSYGSADNATKYYNFFVQQFQGWIASPIDEPIQDMCWAADSPNTPNSQSEIFCHHGNFFFLLISMNDNNTISKNDLNKFAEIMLNKIWSVINVNQRM